VGFFSLSSCMQLIYLGPYCKQRDGRCMSMRIHMHGIYREIEIPSMYIHMHDAWLLRYVQEQQCARDDM
jgi:hypothetical protein